MMELSVEALAEDDIEAAAGELVAKLESKHSEDAALRELRVMSRGDERCRRYIADAGGVEALVSLILQRSNSDSEVQENAITTLLNLSIDPLVRLRITETYSALDAILVLLSYGHTAAVKENAAATLFSLLIVEDYREVVGKHPLAIPALLALLRDAPTRRGKKDAIKGLFHLSLHGANKPRVVAEGGVQLLVSTIIRRRAGLVDESLSVLAILALCEDGAIAIVEASALPSLVEILSVGPPRSRENALAVLLALCQGGDDNVFERVTFYNHQIVSSLCSLLVIGSDRAKRKANEMMRMLVVSDSSRNSMSARSSWQSGSSFSNNSDLRTHV